MTTIVNCAFQNCFGLTSVTIPNSVISIGSYAFYAVNNIEYSGTAKGSPWGAKCVNGFVEGYLVYKDDSKTELLGCSSAATGDLTILNSVTSIGSYAFEGCSSLTKVTIPNSVRSIGECAFEGCSRITSVTIGNSVTIIGSSAFSDCSGLREIHCQSVTPPNVNESKTFSKVNTNHCKLYVPIGTKETYAFAEGWRLFSNIIEEDVISDGDNKCAAPSIAFEDGQLKFTSETPNAKYFYTITDTDIKTSLESCEDGNVKLSATYLITAYAEAEKYSTSDATTATLVWLDARLDGTSTDAKETTVNAKPLLITQDAGIVSLSGLQNGENVSAFDASGKQIATSRAIGAETMIDLSSQQGKVTIINVGGKSVKLMIK